MFEFARFVTRNPSFVTKNARRALATRRAMKAWKKEHPECAWCGRGRKVEVHHIVPVSVAPKMASDPGNMISLCRKPACHLVVGHNGNFAGRYVWNVLELCNYGANVIEVQGP